MAKREGDAVKWLRKKCRITRVRNPGEGESAEVVVYEDAENEFLLFDSDCNDTESDSDGETDEHVVIPPDFSPLYHSVSLPFTANVGMNVLGQSCESIMLFFQIFCTPEFYQHLDDQTNLYASQVVSAAPL
jgi:hypothetical protein